VSAYRKLWQATICYDSKQHYLGTFDTKQEAALAYDKKARQRGKDKSLNYESIKAAEEAADEAQAEHILVHGMFAGPKKPKPRPASGFYGVSARRKQWQAQIRYDSKKHFLARHLRHQAGGSTRIRQQGKAVREGYAAELREHQGIGGGVNTGTSRAQVRVASSNGGAGEDPLCTIRELMKAHRA
jgi:hypothetical protein